MESIRYVLKQEEPNGEYASTLLNNLFGESESTKFIIYPKTESYSSDNYKDIPNSLLEKIKNQWPNQFDNKERIRYQWDSLVNESKLLRAGRTDVIQDFIDLFGKLSDDDENWREIIYEPYG